MMNQRAIDNIRGCLRVLEINAGRGAAVSNVIASNSATGEQAKGNLQQAFADLDEAEALLDIPERGRG